MILGTSGSITATGSTDATIGCFVELWTRQPGCDMSTCTFSISGTWVGTLSFEVADDDLVWVAINALPLSGTQTTVTTTAANGMWRANIAATSKVRVRCSAYTSGTALVTIQGSTSDNG